MTVRAIINSIPKDKFVHFAKGVCVYALFSILFNNPVISFIAVIIASLLVEAYQAITKTGCPEKSDVLADTTGGLFCLIINLSPIINSYLWSLF